MGGDAVEMCVIDYAVVVGRDFVRFLEASGGAVGRLPHNRRSGDRSTAERCVGRQTPPLAGISMRWPASHTSYPRFT